MVMITPRFQAQIKLMMTVEMSPIVDVGGGHRLPLYAPGNTFNRMALCAGLLNKDLPNGLVFRDHEEVCWMVYPDDARYASGKLKDKHHVLLECVWDRDAGCFLLKEGGRKYVGEGAYLVEVAV